MIPTSSTIRAMLFPEDNEQAKMRIKAKAYLSNPFLRKDGSLANKYINYESLLDNPNVNEKVKQYITEATGMTPKVMPVSFSSGGGIISGNNSSDSAPTHTKAAADNTVAKVSGNGNFDGKLGSISAKYEASGWNPGAVSSGEGDYGGISYGIPQFSTTTGSAKSFVDWLKNTNSDMGNAFSNYSPGTTEFSTAWKNVAAKYGDAFGNLQNQYVYDNMVMPFVQRAKERIGVDLNSTPALRELAFSTAIQFGGDGTYALGNINPNMSEQDIINTVYDNKINKVATYFRSSSKDVQDSVKDRFINERKDLLAIQGKV